LVPDAIHIRVPRLAWQPARARDALSGERVDQARFADIRAADEGDFRKPVARESGRADGACHELGFDAQGVSD